ncbi:uncharacterized protein BDZ99DRAFT_402048 [Mytilinidion resinicola]|uniref:non-specific serine/threonine protein kinase n=1 Tax=Mytilinidion resinicola TaxID=574789 RepID=A0A6A6XZX3_9PEZI|nr:uncharacterized protein BDZ99DRAFT_402048 [Mytilinidion resinicola]KAF2802116.1 hypothetical protein BDZ99DRAFT_402048 [Mytilinidion resinicola]
MEPTDTLLSLDMSPHDCYYRFRRDFNYISTVIYVHVRDLGIIPQDCQTYGPDVIKELGKAVEVWNQQWTTLTVFRRDGKIQWLQDDWKPHSLPPHVVLKDVPCVNVLDLNVERLLKNRIFKNCPFEFELEYMVRELRAYNMLRERGCTLIPTISAYVFERSDNQIIGFICEEFKGDFAGPDNYAECKRSLLQLHSYGLIHGDLNKFNIIITANGPRFFDLEKSIFDSDIGLSEHEFSRLQEEELNGLEKALRDEEGWGKPWL